MSACACCVFNDQLTCRGIGIASRVANLGDFSPKYANSGIFLAYGELGDFYGNFESQL
jgi:hypothetical protein